MPISARLFILALIIIPHMLSFPGVFATDPVMTIRAVSYVLVRVAYRLPAVRDGFFARRRFDRSRCPDPHSALRRDDRSGGERDDGPVHRRAAVSSDDLVGGDFSRLDTLGMGPVIIAANVAAQCWPGSAFAATEPVDLRPGRLERLEIDMLLTLSGRRVSLGWYAPAC